MPFLHPAPMYVGGGPPMPWWGWVIMGGSFLLLVGFTFGLNALCKRALKNSKRTDFFK